MPVIPTLLLALLGVTSTAGKSIVYTPTNGILDPADFQQWLTQSASDGYDQLIVAGGTYNVTPESGKGYHVSVSTLNNVEVDFTGVTLVMQARSTTAVWANQLWNCTVRGLQVVYQQVPTNQATILDIARNGKSYVVQVPVGYPLEDWVPASTITCYVFDPATRWWKPGTWDLSMTGLAVVDPAQRIFNVSWGNDYGPDNQNVGVGDLLPCRQQGFAFVFNVNDCENSSFVDITLWGGPGFGYFHTGSDVPGRRGGNTFLRTDIRRPSRPAGATEDPLLSTSADGFHSAGAPIGPIVDSVFFEGMPDDGIAIHGTYEVVTDCDAVHNTVTVVARDFSVGDVVRIYNTTFGPATPSALTITAVAAAPKGYKPPKNVSHTEPGQSLGPGTAYQVLSVSEPVPAGCGFDFILANANRVGSGFVLRNNTITNHRARGMLIKASNGLIINNTVNGSTMSGAQITPELYWGEADYAANLTITQNVFTNLGFLKQSYGGFCVGAINPDNGFASGGGHSNIIITNNTFSNIAYTNIWISSSYNVTLRDNVIEQPFPFPPWAKCCMPNPLNDPIVVFITESSGLNVHNNCVYNAGNSTQSIFNVTATASGSDLVNGVKVCT